MPRYETKILTKNAAFMCAANWRWFANHKWKTTELGSDRFSVRAFRWMWSNIVLLPEDYAP